MGLATEGRIPSLSGLRTVCFAIVFLSHAGITIIPGGFGVTVFFFLSGYLITTLLRVEFESTRTVHLGNFYLRRLLRIWPPFYLILLGAIAVMVVFPAEPPLQISGITAQFLHFTNYWILGHALQTVPLGTGVYWSLAVEEHFYLLFPVAYLFMRRSRVPPRHQAIALWSVCALVLLWRCVLVYHYHVSVQRTFYATDTRIDSILFGCALAVWNNPVLDRVAADERRWKLLIVPAALLALGVCFIIRGDPFRETFRYSIQGIALTFIFIAAIRYENWSAFKLLNTRPMIFFGALSYTLYLVHLVALLNIARLFPGMPPFYVALSALVLSIAIAWLTYGIVEKPCARARQRLLRKATIRLADAPANT